MRSLTLLALLASALPAQGPVLVGMSATAVSGSLCDPWTCTPAPIDVAAGETLGLFVHAGSTPTFVYVSPLPAVCLPLPGVGNSLLLSGPQFLLFLDIRFRIHDAPCVAWLTRGALSLPTAVPSGTRFLLQGVQIGFQPPIPVLTSGLDVTVR